MWAPVTTKRFVNLYFTHFSSSRCAVSTTKGVEINDLEQKLAIAAALRMALNPENGKLVPILTPELALPSLASLHTSGSWI